MTVLIVIVVAGIAIVVLVPLFRQRPEQRDPQAQSSTATDYNDASSSWSGLTVPVTIGVAADHGDHPNRDEGHRDQDDRTGESGWGEHGASGSWAESGDGSGSNGGDDSGGSDGGGDGGNSND